MSVSSFSSAAKPGVCLSTDRPDSPFDGQVIYETDTNRTLVYDNSAWVVIHDPTLMSYSGTGVTVTADAATIGGENVTPHTGRKNAIINGDMRIAQRATSQTISSGGGTMYYACDRYGVDNYTWSGGGQITLSQESTVVPDGFNNALKVSVGSTALTYNSGGYSAVKYSVEGYDASRFYDSTATLSFWVRASVAGTYSILVANNWWGTGSADRGLVVEYSISQADTWEKKSVSINFASGTSAGTWGSANGYGILLQWFLGANANRVGDTYLNSWANWSAYEVMSSNATQLLTNANATFYLTGVQLELGDKATPFEHRSYGEELALCQRYYQKFVSDSGGPGVFAGGQFGGGTSTSRQILHFNVPMRTKATSVDFSAAGSFWINKHNVANYGVSAIGANTYNGNTPNSLEIGVTPSASAGAAGDTSLLVAANTTAYIGVSAEL